MKKTLIKNVLIDLPVEIREIVKNAKWYDSSCSETAKTYFLKGLDNGKNAYLKIIKIGEAPSMEKDVKVLKWLKGKVPVADVLQYTVKNGYEYLLTTEVEGEDATYPDFIRNPSKMVQILGESLKMLHSLDITDCPIDTGFETRLEKFKGKVKNKEIVDGIWEDKVSYMSYEEFYKAAFEVEPKAEDKVFIHGDYCLPNIMIKDDKLSGFIDLGGAGIGDRYFDLAWAFWSLNYNLCSTKWEELFLKSYGMNNIDNTKIKFYLAMSQRDF